MIQPSEMASLEGAAAFLIVMSVLPFFELYSHDLPIIPLFRFCDRACRYQGTFECGRRSRAPSVRIRQGSTANPVFCRAL
jgi:hypothetical protein